MHRFAGWASAAAALAAAFVASAASAATITYNVFASYQSFEIGGTTYTCGTIADGTCAFITMVGIGDTSTVTSYSVPGASGFKNTLSYAQIDVFFADSSLLAYTGQIDLSKGGLYVSVDQTNAGAGFGSAAGPAYPLAAFGGSANYATYDLASDFYVYGFGPFCPDLTLCANGSSLYLTDGTEFKVLRGPLARTSFSSTVSPETRQTVPEPGSIALVGMALAAMTFGRRRRERG